MHVHCDPIVSILEPSCRSELAESRKRKKVVPKSNYRDKYEHLIGGADDVARVGSKGSVQKDASYTQYMFSWGSPCLWEYRYKKACDSKHEPLGEFRLVKDMRHI